MAIYLVAIPYTAECCGKPHVVLYRISADNDETARRSALQRTRWREYDAEEALVIPEGELAQECPLSEAGSLECRECQEIVTAETVTWRSPFSLEEADPDTGVPYHQDCVDEIKKAVRR